MKRYALDTSFIIEFLKGDEKAGKFYQEIKKEELVVPSPVIMEVLRGVNDLRGFQKLEEKGFGAKEAEKATDIIDSLEEKGEMIGIIDVMIAATASENNAEIVTFDRDFEKIDGKQVDITVIGDQ